MHTKTHAYPDVVARRADRLVGTTVSIGGGTDAAGLVPVHIGQHVPGSEAERMLLRQWEQARERGLNSAEEHLRILGDLDWEQHGLVPRWLGQESSDCSVAIDPGHFHNRGADERARFLAGARARGEVAVVLAGIGSAVVDAARRSVFSTSDATVHVADLTYVSGRRLPQGTVPRMVPDLTPEDRDLALRLLNQGSETSAWWALQLGGATTIRGDGWGGETQHAAEGHLESILVDGLGDPVVAAWISEAEDQRWYIVPDGIGLDTLLDWLIKHALPQLVPTALRRVRSKHFADPELQTKAEREAQSALDEFEDAYARDRSDLLRLLHAAQARAESVRDGLLFGTGAQLAGAVAEVLADCGLHVVDLDKAFGATRSADLLITGSNGERRLVEIKSASGSPKEALARDLERHLSTWPQLRPHETVVGGVLIVNHQHRLHPTERTEHVYTRAEFVDSLPFPVLATWQLFRWWAEGDQAAILAAVLPGVHHQTPAGPRSVQSRSRPRWLGRRPRP